jgi:hypothetical protein
MHVAVRGVKAARILQALSMNARVKWRYLEVRCPCMVSDSVTSWQTNFPLRKKVYEIIVSVLYIQILNQLTDIHET